MEKLLKLIWDADINTAVEFEQKDQQFVALKKLYSHIPNKDSYLPLIVANSLVCYQLSATGEKYWSEFSDYFSKKNLDEKNLIDEMILFLQTCKWNKRYTDTKIWRLKKLSPYISQIFSQQKFFYQDMKSLQLFLAKAMNQDISAKTVVFAIKMLWYGARNMWDFVPYPQNISIPIDSRLSNIFEKYKWDYNNIEKFYEDLSKQTGISPLHLDAILWVDYDTIMNS